MSIFNPTYVGMLSASETSHNQGYVGVERSFASAQDAISWMEEFMRFTV